MLAALAGICYAMAVGDDGCRWENDILCGGTARSPGALQPNNGDAPGNGAHAQQQQERLTPYELEKKNEEDNEIQPTIFRGGAKHTMDDGHGHGSEKSADEHTLDDGHKHTKNLKSKYTGCRWENDVHCGGTAAFPGGGTGTKPPTKEEIAAAKKAKQEAPTPYELEMQNEKDNEVQPTIFTGGAKHKGHGSSEKSTVQSTDESSLDDGRNHTKKLKSKYTGCRWENDVHCGGTAAFPGGGTATAPPTKAEIAAAKKAQQEKPTPYELEMENEKDNEVKPTIFDIGGSPPEHSIDDGHHHKKHAKAIKHTLDDGHEHTAKSKEAAAAAKERKAEKKRAAEKESTAEEERAASTERSHLKRKYTGCRWANDKHCGGTESAPPGANGPEKAPADTEDRPDEPSPYELEMGDGKDAGNSPQIFDDSASPSVQIFGEDDGAEPSVATSLHSLADGHDHAAPGDRGIGQ